MKKILLILFSILVIVFGVMTMLDYKGFYSAERDLWKINDKFAHAALDPKSIPDSTFENIAGQYRDFIKKYPDSMLVPAVHILTARVYLTKGDYSKARDKYEEIIKIYQDEPLVAVEATADIVRTYALENDSHGVISTYKRVMNNYPKTPIGMQAPLILAKYYTERGDQIEAKKAYEHAIDHFKTIIKNNPDSATEFNALRSLGATYMASRQFQQAVDIFGIALIKYSNLKYMTQQRAGNLIKTINTISVVELNNYELPVSIYNEFIRKNPDHPFNRSFAEMIKSLKLLKDKKVEFVPPQNK